MITWVDEECRAWAAHYRWLRYGSSGWPPRSLLGKLIEEGPGAGSGSFVARAPLKEDPPAYRNITLALRRMADTHEMEKPRDVVVAHYVYGGNAKSKAPLLRISLPQYWQQLHTAHAFICACAPSDDAAVPREAEPSRRKSASL